MEDKVKYADVSKSFRLYNYCKLCGERASERNSQECGILGKVHPNCCHKNDCQECKELIDLHDAHQIYNCLKEYCSGGTKEIFVDKRSIEFISKLLDMNSRIIENTINIFLEKEIIVRDIYKTRYYLSSKKILPKE